MCSTLFICKKVKVVDTDLCQLLHSQPAYSLMCCSDINQNMCTQTWLSRSGPIYIYPMCFSFESCLVKDENYGAILLCHIKVVRSTWLSHQRWWSCGLDLTQKSVFFKPNLGVTWVWTKKIMISFMNLWTSCSALKMAIWDTPPTFIYFWTIY